MSPFLLYLILKLDAVCMLFTVGAIASGVLALIGFIGGAIHRSDAGFYDAYQAQKANAQRATATILFRIGKRSCAALIVAALLATLTPTTKQVAAIYVLSALTDDQTLTAIERESGEVYGLFKQWLRSEIEDVTPVPEEDIDP